MATRHVTAKESPKGRPPRATFLIPIFFVGIRRQWVLLTSVHAEEITVRPSYRFAASQDDLIRGHRNGKRSQRPESRISHA